MLPQIAQNTAFKNYFEHFIYVLLLMKQPINGHWRLSSQIARTKESPIWLLRSQQLYSGNRQIGLSSILYFVGNRSLRLRHVRIIKISRILMRPHHTTEARPQQLCSNATVVWWRGIPEIIYVNTRIYITLLVSILNHVSVCFSEMADHSEVPKSPQTHLKKPNLY